MNGRFEGYPVNAFGVEHPNVRAFIKFEEGHPALCTGSRQGGSGYKSNLYFYSGEGKFSIPPETAGWVPHPALGFISPITHKCSTTTLGSHSL